MEPVLSAGPTTMVFGKGSLDLALAAAGDSPFDARRIYVKYIEVKVGRVVRVSLTALARWDPDMSQMQRAVALEHLLLCEWLPSDGLGSDPVWLAGKETGTSALRFGGCYSLQPRCVGVAPSRSPSVHPQGGLGGA